MLHLINIEILKLQRNRPFLVLMILFVIGLFGINSLAAEIMSRSPFNFCKFPEVWKIVSYISSYFLVVPGMIMIMHTCSEYTYRTNRQNIIDGLSRDQYITSKILFMTALALFSTLLTAVCAFLVGMYGDASVSFKNFKYIYYFFVQALLYIELSFFFALMFKKAALSIGLFLVYSFIIENILERYLNKISSGIGNIGYMLPLSSSDHLLQFDYVRKALSSINMGEYPKSEYVYLMVSIAYIILIGLVCYFRYRKQDL
ncbi:MAG: ABC transporter permease [Prevotellaceae bacterium]|jgi:hypothetical protein|nr:ABC transporter permease [Prevotellaceae bacterium]